ncbi:hypothetical protein [Mesorhizobium sp. M1B.F.Ca.ET.045.04.1.1]|uniref:hypothetical protein n=1 Tax=Mesorhizobium sp. M1B.F.Ca.ET.045.04.1.1 TaxID=2493673 RepID=UPI001FDFD417|nr:hypothetical protein [Mesorhizobium sp. M1B.F.Ca.ET.045.04.1.1]
METLGRKFLLPKFVALDSSHLGAIAGDKASKDSARVRRAEAFDQAFMETGSVLLLSWHHFQELFSHRSEEVAAQRVAYLQSLPLVASIASFQKEDIVGSVGSLQCFEIAAAFQYPAASAAVVREEAGKNMFRLTSGAELVRPFLESWTVLRNGFVHSEQRTREVVAISKSDFAGNADAKIMDLLKDRIRAPDDMLQQFQRLHGRLAEDIRQRGDKRIPDADDTSRAFIEDVIRIGAEIVRPDNPGLRILQAWGFDLSDIGPDTTLADLGDMAVFRRKLEVLNVRLNLPWPELIARVKEDRLPSDIIYNAIRRFHPDTHEWDGSELTDRYLACLAAYCDVIYVDKRTYEAFRLARQKSETFAALARHVEKAGSYDAIPGQLAARFAQAAST